MRIEIRCSKCGKVLEIAESVISPVGNIGISVKPCDRELLTESSPKCFDEYEERCEDCRSCEFWIPCKKAQLAKK